MSATTPRPSAPSALDRPSIVWDYGVHIDSTLAWFDPRKPRDFAIVSNTRTHLGERQRKLLTGDRTARLVSAVAGKKLPGLVTPFGRPVSLGNLKIELFPSGYLAGAASALVTLPTGLRVAYAGAFSAVKNRTAEVLETRAADVLVLDATYGVPKYRFPTRADVEAEVTAWVDETLADDCTPVVLVACPGKAQDLMQLVGEAGRPLRVHRAIHAWCRAYKGLGIDVPASTQFRGHPSLKEVLFWPAHLRRSPAIRNLRRARFAVATGTAMDPGAEKRLKVNRAFIWSARSDFDGLLAYAKATGAPEIVTIGRHSVDLAELLTARGHVARALTETPQLTLL